MANFEADILVDLQVTQAERQIQRLERQLQRLQTLALRALNVDSSGLNKAKQGFQALEKSSKNLLVTQQKLNNSRRDGLTLNQRLSNSIRNQTAELERQASAAKRALAAPAPQQRRSGGGGSRSAGIDPRIAAETSRELDRQLTLLSARARALKSNKQIAEQLRTTEQELRRSSEANLQLVQKKITNARRLITEEERRAAAVEKSLKEEERLRDQIARKEAQEAEKRIREADKIGRARARAAQKGLALTAQPLTGGGGVAGGAIRGGVGLAAAGLAGAGAAAVNSAASTLNNLQSALEGVSAASPVAKQALLGVANAVPTVDGQVAELARTVMDVTGNYGMAAAALMAFAPALPTVAKGAANAAKATLEAGNAAGAWAKNLGTVEMELNSAALAAQGYGEQIKRNIELSQRARAATAFPTGTGFQDAIDRRNDARAVQKSIARNRRNRANRANPTITPQLLLPDSKMLNAAARGIEDIIERGDRAFAASAAKREARLEREGESRIRRANKLRAIEEVNASKVASAWERAYDSPAGPGNSVGEARYRSAKATAERLVRLEKETADRQLAIQRARVEGEKRLNLRRLRQAEAAAEQIKQRNRGIRAGIGSGLAFSGLPGQGIAQAGLAGSTLGGVRGGIAGILTAIGAEAIKAAGPIAVATAELDKFRIALRGVAGEDYSEALAAIERAVDDFNVPLRDATQQFTQLSAAATASGIGIAETEKVYRGLISANTALGGDAEKLQGILLATTQVFSKGRVQAEELRGQIGERLAGAFALFAEASGKSTAELDRSLSKGEVSLRDFVQFAEFLLKKYEGQAGIIADAPANAGARLQKTIEKLQQRLGPALADLGSRFQNFARKSIDALEPLIQVIERFNEIFNLGQQGNIKAYTNALADLATLDQTISAKEQKLLEATDKTTRDALSYDIKSLEDRRAQLLKRVTELGASIPPELPTGGRRTPTEDDPLNEQGTKLRNTLNAALQQRLRLLADIEGRGKSRIEQLQIELSLLDDIAKLERERINAEDLDPASKAAELSNVALNVSNEAGRIVEELAKARSEVAQIERDLIGVSEKFTGTQVVGETPYERMLKQVRAEAASAKAEVDALITRLNQLAPQNDLLGNLATNALQSVVQGAENPELTASQRLVQGDVEEFTRQNAELEKQIELLSQGRTELSALDRLVIQYGDDWEKLDSTVKGQLVNLARQNEELEATLTQLQRVKKVSDSISGVLFDGLSDAAMSLLNSTKSLQQVFADMFRSLGDVFLNVAKEGLTKLISKSVQNILKDVAGIALETGSDAALTAALTADTAATTALATALTSNTAILTAALVANTAAVQANTLASAIPRAAGGPITSGQPYLVGEVGPELILPNHNGTVVPNDQLTEALERLSKDRGVSADSLTISPNSAGASSSDGFADAAAALAATESSSPFEEASAAMEMASSNTMASIKAKQEQKAFAEATAQMSSSSTRIALDTQVINSVEYATMDQVMKVGQQSAQKARADVFKDLKNMPATRGRAGVR